MAKVYWSDIKRSDGTALITIYIWDGVSSKEVCQYETSSVGAKASARKEINKLQSEA